MSVEYTKRSLKDLHERKRSLEELTSLPFVMSMRRWWEVRRNG